MSAPLLQVYYMFFMNDCQSYDSYNNSFIDAYMNCNRTHFFNRSYIL